MSHNGLYNIPLPKNEPVKNYTVGSQERQDLNHQLKLMADNPIEIPLVIGGQKKFSEQKDPVVCPHNKNKVIAYASVATKEDVTLGEIIDVMKAEFGEWKETSAF